MSESLVVHTQPTALAPTDLLPRDQHPAWVYLASLAPGSRRTMAQALEAVAELVSSGQCTTETLPWHGLRYQHTAAIRSQLAERYRPATANKVLSALRGVLKQSWRLGLMDGETYHRAADVGNIRSETLPRGRALSQGEIGALFRVCVEDTSPAGARDVALLALLYACGLRRSEAVAISLENYDPETGSLTVRGGKGRKDRTAYAENGARDALGDWLKVRDSEPGPLLCPVGKGGHIDLRQMTGQAVLYILRKRATQAGVGSFSPHDLRRTFIGDLLDAGADISTVQKLAGHARPDTTARYDRRGEAVKKKAAAKLHVPYRSSQ